MPKKRAQKASNDLQERLFNLCDAKRDGSKTVIIQLLQAVGRIIHFS